MTRARAGCVALLALLGGGGCGASERTTGPRAAPSSEPVSDPEAPIAGESAGGRPRLCAGEVANAGVVGDPRLTEISGLVASRREPGVLWAHNDSGEPSARFFALTLDGTTRAEIEIEGAPHVDWEDVARFTTPDGRELLYFADTGDNGARDGSFPVRSRVDVVVVEPPPLPPGITPDTIRVSVFELLSFVYPDGPHDCEAILVDDDGDLYLFTKTNDGPHTVFRDAAPHAPGTTRTLERLLDVLPGASLRDAITAADIDPHRLVVRTYGSAFEFERAPGASIVETLGTAPLVIAHFHEHQGEAIAIAADGTGLFTVSEGDSETLHYVPVGACPP